ncbi:hypothetical protein GCM10011289_35410 [Paludibacterium paludis]|uniref:Uncharacterized protein n=1 Tax=Paludibacterium paludis TaxID=1225769 RepID=A0A918P6R0_9NEIS|nr:hypothetical protein GCM10011289_35410 [Paludibacterium paludis]
MVIVQGAERFRVVYDIGFADRAIFGITWRIGSEGNGSYQQSREQPFTAPVV